MRGARWLSLAEAVDEIAEEMGIASDKDEPGGNSEARARLLAAFAQGRRVAEGQPGDEPPRYETIPEAWWTLTLPAGMRRVRKQDVPGGWPPRMPDDGTIFIAAPDGAIEIEHRWSFKHPGASTPEGDGMNER